MVRWSLRARADLKAIHEHIREDSPRGAKIVVRDIVSRSEFLDQMPHIGRMVPELGDASIREIPVHSWRVIYQIRDTGTFILTVIHKRRLSVSIAAMGD